MRLSTGMAGYADKLIDRGITWDELVARCKPEAEKRGLTCLNTIGKLRQHARYRAEHNKWPVVVLNDERVRITRPVIPE